MWKILGQYQAYNVNTKWCPFYLNEKMQIAIYRGNDFSKWRRRNKYALWSCGSIGWNITYKVDIYWRFLASWFIVFVK